MNDDILTLYYYHDGLSNRERQQVANAIATDPSIAARYHELSRQLGQLDSGAEVAPRSDMVQRWHDSIDKAAAMAARDAPRRWLHTWSFILGAAVTAALAIGIGIGVFIGDQPEPTQGIIDELVAAGEAPRSEPPAAFIRGLRVHLRDSERGLSALPAEQAAERTLLVMNIIEQNRLFARAAQQNNSDKLARVLKAFELVLVRLAAEDISPQDAEALRARLLFELNVMLTKLAQDSSDEPGTI